MKIQDYLFINTWALNEIHTHNVQLGKAYILAYSETLTILEASQEIVYSINECSLVM